MSAVLCTGFALVAAYFMAREGHPFVAGLCVVLALKVVSQ